MKLRGYAGTLLTMALFLGCMISGQGLAADQPSANIMMYHRFGENRYPSTNIRLEQFDAHLERLKQGGYQVLPLIEVVRRLKQGLALPERSVALTVDDAYVSFATEAWPRLRRRGMPVTLFVATDPVDQGLRGYLDWETIRDLEREGVTIGHHGASHGHFPLLGTEATRADIQRASTRFRKELGKVPSLLAYPFGEYDPEIATMIEEIGFMAAFGQHSSPATTTSDFYAMPRFALNEAYGTESRFTLVAGARPMPVRDVLPNTPILTPATNPPLFGFTVDPSAGPLGSMGCFPSHLDRAADIVKPGPRRIEVRFVEPFPKGRNRINCTLRAPDGRYYWYGAFFFQTGAEE